MVVFVRQIVCVYIDRCRLLELTSALQSLIYSYSDVRDHFSSARCCHRLLKTSLLKSSSPHLLKIPRFYRDVFPTSLLKLRPHRVDVDTRWGPLDDRHIASLATLISIFELALTVDYDTKSVRNDIENKTHVDYSPLSKLQLLTNLRLTVGLWEDAAPVIHAVGSQLTTLILDNNKRRPQL